jgi:hypothetical protein
MNFKSLLVNFFLFTLVSFTFGRIIGSIGTDPSSDNVTVQKPTHEMSTAQ